MWRAPWFRYLMIVLTSALADSVYTLYILACSRDWVWVAALLGSSLPFLQFVGSATFVEAKSLKEKFLVTAAVSFGMFLGAAGALLAFAK